MNKLLKLSLFFGLFIFVLTLATTTYAINDNSSENAQEKAAAREELKKAKLAANEDVLISVSPGKNKETMELRKEAKISQMMERKANKLSEARLKICELREKNIENRFKTLLTLGVNTHKGKEKMVERVDAFYNNKLVPAGHTLANYAALKADIEAKEAAVAELLASAQENGESFSCDSEDPKAQTDDFKQNIQDLLAANRAYKTSVKTFVIAVRDLAKQAKAENNPSPAVSPGASPAVSPVVSPEVTETP